MSFLLTLTKRAKNRRFKRNFIKNILPAASDHAGYSHGHGLGLPPPLLLSRSHAYPGNAEQHKETEQEHTPDSSYIPGQQIHSGANCTNRKQQEYSQKDTGFVDGEFSRIHFSAPPIHI